ncbi:FAD-binding oxidoreductase [Anaeromyxobacter oryzae]|uniref:FAD-linked oxidase n=1 Tax=Anaeromyxobacter oryzae TaxID=2918170 RepID=A0ABM7X1V8_9BACT|nr:FAD-binding oxidoreductase [Anaeromyxobacter oryzae]BDG05760.1 FAD-linked oxidase [Anaeromyxobacter oryzae]
MSWAAHTAAASDVVAGVPARVALEPASLEEAADAMSALARDRLCVTFVGGGTELGLGAAPARLDAVLHTHRLAGVKDHAPADQIVHVGAGLTLAALQRHLAPHGQRLALDAPRPERATLGGLLAANGFGPRRTRYGTLRDLVIGITVVRADGTVARGGGKVVKNVAGFDLPRLFCGSLGTLGLVAEVILRLHPLPEASETVVVPGLSAVEARGVARAAAAAFLEPTAAIALPEEGGRFRLLLRFEGFGPGVKDQADRLAALAVAEGRRPERLAGADEAAAWARHDALRTAGDVWLKAAFVPAAIDAAAASLAEAGRALRGGALLLYPTLGLAWVTGTLEDGAAPAVAAAVEAARGALRAGHGSVVVAAAPTALRARLDAWGTAPGGLAVMQRLKHELDPDGRLAPGRLAGGI